MLVHAVLIGEVVNGLIQGRCDAVRLQSVLEIRRRDIRQGRQGRKGSVDHRLLDGVTHLMAGPDSEGKTATTSTTTAAAMLILPQRDLR